MIPSSFWPIPSWGLSLIAGLAVVVACFGLLAAFKLEPDR